jgi:hypothetical protein
MNSFVLLQHHHNTAVPQLIKFSPLPYDLLQFILKFGL